jgi:hypothetical protein
LWLSVTALIMPDPAAASLGLQILDDLSFVAACLASCFFMMAVFLRFAMKHWPVFDSLRNNAYGMYLLHYAFVVWLQYAMLPVELPAILKASIVFGGTLLLSWSTTSAIRCVPAVAQIIGTNRARGVAAS